MEKHLKFLTIDDQALLIESSRRITFPRGSSVIEQGDDRARALYTICSGVARVEIDGVAIAHLGSGALVGEMAFLQSSPASASVVAHTDLGVDVIDSEHLHTLLASVPGFATRFYASLAAVVSGRLRAASQLASSSNLGLQTKPPPRRWARFLPVTESPDVLFDEIDDLCAELAARARQSRSISADAPSSPDLMAQVVSLCDRLHGLLTRASTDHSERKDAIGDYVFRQAFPYLMASRINDHAFSKPHGYDGDGELLELLHDGRAHGHTAFGAAVDRWVLERPFARALRSRGAWLLQSLRELTDTWHGRMPVPVMCLATGNAMDLLGLLDHPRALDVTCLETDPQALQSVAKRVRDHLGPVRISFIQTNLRALGRGRGHMFVHMQKVIIAADVLNRCGDDDAIALLDWMHDCLRPDGALIMGQLRPDHPDRAYLEHMLMWRNHYRDGAAVERLFAASKLGQGSLTLEQHEDGVQMKVICRRRDKV